MAVLSTFTSATDVEEMVRTELLSDAIANFEFTARVGQAIAWSSGGKGTIVKRFARDNAAVTVTAGSKTESDIFTDQEYATTESSITPAIVGMRIPLSEEMIANSEPGVPAHVLRMAMEALLDRIDSDVLSSTTAATNQAGSVTREYTLSEFRSDLNTFVALDTPQGQQIALALHHNGAADLLDSLHSTAANFAKEGGDSLRMGPGQGFVGRLYDVDVYRSANVATESTGHSGILTPVGAGASALGIVMSRMPTMEESHGDDAVLRAVRFYVFSAWYGTGLTNPRRCLEVLHQ